MPRNEFGPIKMNTVHYWSNKCNECFVFPFCKVWAWEPMMNEVLLGMFNHITDLEACELRAIDSTIIQLIFSLNLELNSFARKKELKLLLK